jgi:hypothetical protein
MAVGRISGPLLSKNLLRDGVDLSFETTLLYLDVTTGRIGIKTDFTPTNTFDPKFGLVVNTATQLLSLTVLNTATIVGQVFVTNLSSSVSTSTGAVVVAGGVGIAENLHVGGNASVKSLDASSTATFLSTVLITTGTNSTSTTSGALQISGGVGITKDAIIGGAISINNSATVLGVTFLYSTATSTSTTSGALQVAGGVGVTGSVYSFDGNPHENNLLYTPAVTVTSTATVAPANPRVGDQWICTDPTVHAWFQYIQDGTQRIWVQVTTI